MPETHFFPWIDMQVFELFYLTPFHQLTMRCQMILVGNLDPHAENLEEFLEIG